MKLTGTTFAADGGFTAGLSVLVGFVSAGLFLRSGLIRGIGLAWCLVMDGKVARERLLRTVQNQKVCADRANRNESRQTSAGATKNCFRLRLPEIEPTVPLLQCYQIQSLSN
jgi:hypothetical protein